MPRPQPAAASHFVTALLQMREKVPAEIAAFTTRLAHFMYFELLAAPAQSHAAAMLVRMSAIAVGFWQRAVVQSPSAARVTAGTPVRASRDTTASTWTLAPFIRYPLGLDRPVARVWVPCEGGAGKAGPCPIGRAGGPFGGSCRPFGGRSVYGRAGSVLPDAQLNAEGVPCVA